MKADARAKTGREGWVLDKQPITFADEGTWSNRDTDVTPLERRTWTSWTVLGYWMSDALSVQSWAGASAIIAVGLTWYVYFFGDEQAIKLLTVANVFLTGEKPSTA